MVAVAKQVSIGGLDTEHDRNAEKKAARRWRFLLWEAIQSFVESYIDVENGLKQYDGCAYRLSEHWDELGRPVSAQALKNALLDQNRNNFRLEWAYWFASQDQDIAKLLAMQVKPKKTAEDRCNDWEAVIRARYSHREAEKIIREVMGR
jgi:hypothetical protein